MNEKGLEANKPATERETPKPDLENIKATLIEIATSAGGQQKDLAELRVKYADEVAKAAELVSKQHDIIGELNVYKWLGRFILVGLLAIGLFLFVRRGVVMETIISVVDDRIREKSVATDQMNLTVALANAGNWNQALNVIRGPWSDFTESGKRVTGEYKEWLFQQIVWILSNVDQQSDDGFVGGDIWADLSKRQDFIKLRESPAWISDPAINYSLAWIVLKYEDSPDATTHTRRLLARGLGTANDAAESDMTAAQKADRFAMFAMLDLLEGKIDSALANMRVAAQLNPSDYLLKDRIVYKNTFVRSSYFKTFSRLAERRHGPPFAAMYDIALKRIAEEGETGNE